MFEMLFLPVVFLPLVSTSLSCYSGPAFKSHEASLVSWEAITTLGYNRFIITDSSQPLVYAYIESVIYP